MRHPGFLVPTAGDPGGSFGLDGTEGRVVLVSLSTTDLGQGPLLQTILDALDGHDVHALVTTGAQRFGSSLRVPANVAVRDYVPHASILPHVDAVITHGGLGTVAAALSHGVPLVCTPIARDQPLNAQRVAELGAGVVVPAATATPDARPRRARGGAVRSPPSRRRPSASARRAPRPAGRSRSPPTSTT